MMRCVTMAILLAALHVSSAVAQQLPAPPPEPSEDIVVTGLSDIGGPVTLESLRAGPGGPGAVESRKLYALEDRYAHCAINGSTAVRALLRQTLDGTINSSRQRFGQQQLVRIRSACALDPTIARNSGVSVTSTKFDPSYYERGALTIEALRRFEPALTLTAAQTGDPAVQARFNAREVTRARFRLPLDQKYFETAICLVRLQPEVALKLVRTDKPIELTNRLAARIVNRSPICTGNAKQVLFDVTQFRFYLADAVYRWAVAAKGVESLIPVDQAGHQ